MGKKTNFTDAIAGSRNSKLGLTAVLVAGGQSQRMGTDKATLLINGKPLWQRQIEVLGELKPEALLISARKPVLWRPVEIEIVIDAVPSNGPLSGLAAALKQLKTSHLLAMAIDLPRMTSDHLQKLSHFARHGVGVIPRRNGYFEPLCAIYPVEALAAAEAALKSEDASLQSLARILVEQDRMHIFKVSTEDKPLYLNLNSPSDLQAIT